MSNSYEDYLVPLLARKYSVSAQNYLWGEYDNSPSNPQSVSVAACQYTKETSTSYGYYGLLMNSGVRDSIPACSTTSLVGGETQKIVATFNNPISTKKWMTQLWDLIKHVPANEFIFMGCHDALASHSYTAVSAYSEQAYAQNNRFEEMLNAGCRYFDLRFSEFGSASVKDLKATHSSAYWYYKVSDALDALQKFFAGGDNDREIVVIKLTLYRATNPYSDFVNAAVNDYGLRIINPSGIGPEDAIELLQNKGNIVLIPDSSQPEPYWPSDCMWTSVKNWGRVETPIQWFNGLIDSGDCLSRSMPDKKKFSYLAMQQNDAIPGNHVDVINGPLVDWLVYAAPGTRPPELLPSITDQAAYPDVVRNALASDGFPSGKLVLPYQSYVTTEGTKKWMRNYNLIGMDYFQVGLGVINAITRNLIFAQSISPKLLAFIKTTKNQNERVEVHIASSESNYQSWILEVATTFFNETDGVWQLLPNLDLVFIKTANTPNGHVEVHIASYASNYQSRILDTATTFFNETDGVWQLLPNLDLVFIKTANTPNGHVEVHIASYALNYQSRILDAATTFFNETDGVWQLLPNLDLVFIKTANTPSGHVEVHIASYASQYQMRTVEISTAFTSEIDGRWSIPAVGAMLRV